MSDGGLLAYCLAEGRVLVTNDNDFLAANEPRTVLIDPESELGRGLNENNGGPVMLLCGAPVSALVHEPAPDPTPARPCSCLSIYGNKCYATSCAERR